MKTQQISRDEQAARMVSFMIEAGLIVKGHGECPSGDFTVGPFMPAVGLPGFALYGYGVRVPAGYRARETATAIEAARLFVSCVGSTRARQAALTTSSRPPFSTAGVDVAKKKAEHARSCRAIRCRECGIGQ